MCIINVKSVIIGNRILYYYFYFTFQFFINRNNDNLFLIHFLFHCFMYDANKVFSLVLLSIYIKNYL
jgi:hypothetical protein